MRKQRIVWSGPDCLLDPGDPASAAILSCLSELHSNGCDINIVGATVTSSGRPENAITLVQQKSSHIRGRPIRIREGSLRHQLIRTLSPRRDDMTNSEQNQWFMLYSATLDHIKPDLVMLHGERILERLAQQEATLRGIPCAALQWVDNRHTLPVDACITLSSNNATRQLHATLQPLLDIRAGDQDQKASAEQSHLLLHNDD